MTRGSVQGGVLAVLGWSDLAFTCYEGTLPSNGTGDDGNKTTVLPGDGIGGLGAAKPCAAIGLCPNDVGFDQHCVELQLRYCGAGVW